MAPGCSRQPSRSMPAAPRPGMGTGQSPGHLPITLAASHWEREGKRRLPGRWQGLANHQGSPGTGRKALSEAMLPSGGQRGCWQPGPACSLACDFCPEPDGGTWGPSALPLPALKIRGSARAPLGKKVERLPLRRVPRPPSSREAPSCRRLSGLLYHEPRDVSAGNGVAKGLFPRL